MMPYIRIFKNCKRCDKLVFIDIQLGSPEFPVFCKECNNLYDKLIDESLNELESKVNERQNKTSNKNNTCNKE